MRHRVSKLLAVLAIVCTGCGSPDADPAAFTSAPLSRAAETRDVYRPPSDGKVTPAQVETYLSVLDRVRLDLRGARSTPTGDPLSTLPADVAAAQARGVNVEEFLWVKERVLEAEAATMTAKLNASAFAMLEKTLADLKESMMVGVTFKEAEKAGGTPVAVLIAGFQPRPAGGGGGGN